jgi:DNA-binding transcriptional MocR family regulator
MPPRPPELKPRQRARIDPRNPYEIVAVDLARRIESGELRTGDPAPTADELIARHGIATSTARRAVALVKDWGLLVSHGHGRPRVTTRHATPATASDGEASAAPNDARFWFVVVRGPAGALSAPRMVRASLDDPETFRRHLAGIARAEDPTLPNGAEWIGDYEIEIRATAADEPTAILRWG